MRASGPSLIALFTVSRIRVSVAGAFFPPFVAAGALGVGFVRVLSVVGLVVFERLAGGGLSWSDNSSSELSRACFSGFLAVVAVHAVADDQIP